MGSSAEVFRYLIAQRGFNDITEGAQEAAPSIRHYWIFGDRKENFGIGNIFIKNEDISETKKHFKFELL